MILTIVRWSGPLAVIVSLMLACEAARADHPVEEYYPVEGYAVEGHPDAEDCEICPQGHSRWNRGGWLASRANDPVGARQRCKYGKLWPPFPRPTGPKQHFIHRYHAAHYWPYPYNLADRQSVRLHSQQQIDSGWVEALTLYDHHFEIDSQQLNHAGQRHLLWILESVPESRQAAFVQSSFDPELNQQRVAHVHTSLVQMLRTEDVPPVVLRPGSATGRPALEIDMIRRWELERTPQEIPYPIRTRSQGGLGGVGQ